MNEFDFIHRYLQHQNRDESVLLGIGDDAAIVRPRPQHDLHISADMLVSGRHFFADTAPDDLAHKVLAVNLSDMAAMGAKPRWILLSAALPELDENWLEAFCRALFEQAQQYSVSLIGGDTTRGPLCFNITIIGEAPAGEALRRSGAQIGDDIWVSGSIGIANAALQHLLGKIRLPESLLQPCSDRLLRPVPRIALGQALRPIAHAAQDISDGLAQDLRHILHASHVSAELWLDNIPTAPELRRLFPEQWAQFALNGGDDYELVFTASPAMRSQITAAAQHCGVAVSRIGKTDARNDKMPELNIRQCENGAYLNLPLQGFDHFTPPAD